MAERDTQPEPAESSLKRREFLGRAARGAAAAAGAGALAACAPSPGGAVAATAEQPNISWRMTTSFPPSLDILHGSGLRIAERVAALTGNRFQIRVFAAGEVVPGLQVMDAVQQGTVQCGLSPSYYYIGKNPALAFDTAIPMGLTTRQHAAWLYHGGGNELIRDIFSDFGIVQFPAANTGAQWGGWFRNPVESVSDLRGLRFRIPGIGAEINARMGVSVQTLSGADIYPALERGAIDATEWVGPYDDEKLGFYQIAKNYYYPGWWEPSASSALMVSSAAWAELPESYQNAIEVATRETMYDSVARYDVENPPALARLVSEQGVTARPFSNEIMESAWRESNGYLEEQAAQDASFKKVYDSWKAFREESFSYFAGNELTYARFAYLKLANGTAT